ncbi:expressed unknown protein [Seminavis robusta]|uniref:Elongator complex protein 5 n=1 Tax=Seminavis robusta TaxID=568900 RepID=A0A9N8HP50_9STRA|nr:expressed unknown protein [Seminavis robusta]|eukprot:Sro1289_g259680.1 n/a (444) ;mRNA; r:9382-10713
MAETKSKPPSSAAQQLLQKLLEYQQSSKDSNDNSHHKDSPLILFQYTCHISQRLAAATQTQQTANTTTSTITFSRTRVQQQQDRQHAKVQAEADLYRRARLRTPDENAKRAIWGGALWLEYLTQSLLHVQQQQQATASTMIWISTTTRQIPSYVLNRKEESLVKIMSCTSIYQTSADDNTDDDDVSTHPLADLLRQIKQHCSSTKTHCTSIVIESLTPWIQLYGFSTVYQFIQALIKTSSNSLVFIPVLTETLSTAQHRQLEDLSHTCLWLSNHTGQVDLHVLRRGIREQDNRVREIWEFEIAPDTKNDTTNSRPFSLHVGTASTTDDEQEDSAAPPDQVNLVQAMNPALTTEETAPRPAIVTEDTAPAPISSSVQEVTKRAKKISLQFEDDSNASQTKQKPVVTQQPAATPPPANAPRIFLQDDDPEYEDYDSDDLDDDLDI